MAVPLISIVVPTHNRADYAISCIEAVLAYREKELELVVSDTSTDRRLYEMLHGESCHFLADRRLVYTKIDEPSNLTKNHNAAMELATGRYICIIGDDDCITQAAIDAARWASACDVPAVSQRIATIYAWPDFRSILARGGHAGRLYVPRKAGKKRWRNAKDDLRSALVNAFQGTDNMPRCYHGIVRRDLLQNVKDKTGAYFHGSSPDMSGAVALACQLDRYCETDIPLSISGVSGGSNSGRSAMNTHKGDLTSESQTSDFNQDGWIDGVPKFFSVETVWAHAGLSTLREMQPELMADYNYSQLFALCRVAHSEYKGLVQEAMIAANKKYNIDFKIKTANAMRVIRWNRIKYLIKRGMNPTAAYGRKYFPNQNCIARASEAYKEYSNKKGFDFLNVDFE